MSDSGEKNELYIALGIGMHQESCELRAQTRCERQYQESYEQLWKGHTKEAGRKLWTSLDQLQTRNKRVGAAAFFSL